MGLRLAEGIDLDPPRCPKCSFLRAGGLGADRGRPCRATGERRIRATPNGRFILNEIVLRLAR